MTPFKIVIMYSPPTSFCPPQPSLVLIVLQCAKIASEFGYTHLSTGDLLREEQKKESDLASKIDDCIR